MAGTLLPPPKPQKTDGGHLAPTTQTSKSFYFNIKGFIADKLIYQV